MLGEQGAAFFNKCLNFKSGSGLSTLLINRAIEDEGGRPFTTLDRYSASVGYTVAPEKAVGLVPLLATDCTFEKWDMRDTKILAETEAEEASQSAQIVLTENLFAAAYGPQSPAGRPLYSTGTSVDAIKTFRSRAYGMNGAILTATGVKDHAAFCAEAESLLSDAPGGTPEGPAPITYLGGESRVSAPSSGYAHVALAFQSPSAAVTDVVKQVFNIFGSESGVSGFSTMGLIGVYAGSTSPGSITGALTKTITSTVSPDIVKRAKSLAKAEALFALDGGSKSLAASMTASVLESGCCFSGPKDVVARYDAVTDAQVKEAISTMLKSNPSLAAVGDITSVSYHATVASQLK